MTKELICICCPMGCRMTIDLDGEKVVSVTGNTCKRGSAYAVTELTAPVRMVTTTVRTADGVSIPVKTKEPVPKERIFDCVSEIKKAEVTLPVKVGDVIIDNVASTGIPVVAAKTVPCR